MRDLPNLVRAAIASASGDPVSKHRARAEPYLSTLPGQTGQRGSSYVIGPGDHWLFTAKQQPWYREFMDAPDADRVSLGIALLDGMNAPELDQFSAFAAPTVLSGLARRVPGHDRDDRHLVLSLAKRIVDRDRWHQVESVMYGAAVLERAASLGDPIDVHEDEVRAILDTLSVRGSIAAGDEGRIRSRLLRLIGQTTAMSRLIDRGDTWGVDLLAYLERESNASALEPLLLHLADATSVSPTQRWRARTEELLRLEDAESLIRHMVDASLEARSLQRRALDASPFQPANASLVRGAYWAAAVGRWDWVPETLGRAGLHWALSGRNDNYARDQRLANTTVALLADLGTPETLVALGRIQAKVRNRNVAKSVAAALDRAAMAAGMTASELLELAVPRMNLDDQGRREIAVGPGIALLGVGPGGDATLEWSVGGRISAAVPKAVLDADKSGVTAAKAELKELRKALSVERGRLEDLLVEERTWAYPAWVERYRRHPLTAAVAARLIWRFQVGDHWLAGMTDGDAVTSADGASIELGPSTRVAVWHPIHATPDEISAWRTFLLERGVRQPFKQAFREVYLLTPAEEATEVYSNRFAGHVLDYPVARALMGARRWGTNFLGPFDGGYEGIAKRDFRSDGVRAEFYHDGIEGADDDLGAVAHCTTDQVRFVRLGRDGDVVPLRDVPPVVFSEAMRDVDLFVGVSSIAADVNWQDAGRDRNARFDEYWGRTAFGELTASAESRREVLAWMLPQLAIADRLTLEDRYLRVRGDRRTYRIHLGSANILMEPNDEYLCIVPGRGPVSTGAGRVLLPFDDDHRLSVILSKAMLLANDRAITDPSIVRQIDR